MSIATEAEIAERRIRIEAIVLSILNYSEELWEKRSPKSNDVVLKHIQTSGILSDVQLVLAQRLAGDYGE